MAGLVRALGGMPLAILLAASWIRLLPVSDMVSDLEHLLDVLEQAGEGESGPSIAACARPSSNRGDCSLRWSRSY